MQRYRRYRVGYVLDDRDQVVRARRDRADGVPGGARGVLNGHTMNAGAGSWAAWVLLIPLPVT
ncbi:hypothetical protein Raf01_71790 [Rugosimonospora africana]|uniref:Uncharacterized protein n=1 Tax=Rugosimonospora africana TaxID=556532 RepID=A0A8J3QZP0_9ACTN|nr:hypothetical protein Raf01_71790 [Rugosimonospora africana]